MSDGLIFCDDLYFLLSNVLVSLSAGRSFEEFYSLIPVFVFCNYCYSYGANEFFCLRLCARGSARLSSLCCLSN